VSHALAVATTAAAGSCLAAVLHHHHLEVVLTATFLMRHEARMVPTTPEPLAPPEPSAPGAAAAPLDGVRVWVVGFARQPRDDDEAGLRLWVSHGDCVLVDRVVRVEPERWARPGQAGRLDLAASALGPQGAAEQRVEALCGHEWIGVAGPVLEPAALIAQLPDVCATARLYRRGVAGGRDVQLAADCVVIDAGAWSCTITWRGCLDVAADGDEGLHVVGGVTIDGCELATKTPFVDLRGTGPVGDHVPQPVLPFRPAAGARPARRGALAEGDRAVLPATPFDVGARPSPPSARPPTAFTLPPPSSLPPVTARPAISSTLDDVGSYLGEDLPDSLPFIEAPARLVPRPAPAEDPNLLPFRARQVSFGAAFLEVLEALERG
jgi:hypothetical protein